MKINYNVSAMIANASLNKSDSKLSESIERLSTGFKINHAKDNAAGLAMAKRMNAQIRSLETANQNANDGISVVQIAEGALQEIEDMTQRISELATKAATATITDDDRVAINAEITQLKDEIERVAKDTSYNGLPLLDGTFDLKGFTSESDVKVSYYSDDVRSGDYELTDLSVVFNDDGTIQSASGGSISLNGEAVSGLETTYAGNTVTLKNQNGFEIHLQVRNSAGTSGTPVSYGAAGSPVNLELKGIGSMGVQIGTNEGQMLDVRIPTISLENMGIANLKVTNEADSAQAMADIKKGIEYISSVRAKLGAYQNRLEHTTNSLDITNEGMTAAYSRIMDTDMATEMTEYSKNQVLVQAGTSMLAQANERPSQVLQLLQ